MAMRKTASTRHGRTTEAPVSLDKLAEQVSSKLKLSNPKTKQVSMTVLSDEEACLSAMRSVNSSARKLSAIVQSGWKRSSGTSANASKQNFNVIVSLTTATSKNLADLRQMSPNDVDVERAAVSFIGKLVTLEMFDEALSFLDEMYPRLCSFHNSMAPPASEQNQFRLMSIPLSEKVPLDPTLLSLTSTYLTYALIILSATCFARVRVKEDTLDVLSSFSAALENGSTLLTWVPSLSSLPQKQLDSILTRVYTALVKSCATCTNSPRAVFITRLYALRCLVHTTTGTIEPNNIWNQAMRFGATLIKAQVLSDEEATGCVLSAYCDIVNTVGEKSDYDNFMSGKDFIRFSEYWLHLAQKAGNISVLDRIGDLMQRTSLRSLSPHGTVLLASPHEDENECTQQEIKEENQIQTMEGMMRRGHYICAVLAQTTATLERDHPDSVKRAEEITNLLVKSRSFIGILRAHNEDETRRIDEKLIAALERLRHPVITFLESPRSDPDKAALRLLIEEMLQIWLLPGDSSSDVDNISRSVETLFVLARTILSPTDPSSYLGAHDYLTRTMKIVEAVKPETLIDTANLVRCISGAFHNIAATLYQAGRHGAAIGFLRDACSLGVRALSMSRTIISNKPSERTEEGWRQLDDHLYRRWELLGVCYSKIGDRKQAFGALCHCVETFPYVTSGFSERVEECTLATLFDMSSSTKQLGVLIDKLTYLAACELLMEADLVSLASLNLNNPGITGVLLERQVKSLEPYRWRNGVQAILTRLLGDALNIYTEDMPIRRARVLLKCIDFAYHADLESLPGMKSPEEIALEIEKLLESKEFRKDVRFDRFRYQYQASAHLWLTLYAHRRTDMQQGRLIKFHSDSASTILKRLLDTNRNDRPTRKSSPKQILPSKKVLGPPLPRSRSKKVVLSRKLEPVTPKSKLKKDQYLIVPKTPPRINGPARIPLDDVGDLLILLQLTAQITGLLGYTISKIHILDIIRKLCDRQTGSASDGFIMASIDLAYEYVKVGKAGHARTIFDQILVPVKSGKVSEEIGVFYFLRFAEFLALTEKIDDSTENYHKALTLLESVEIENKDMPTAERVHIRVKNLVRAAVASRVYSLVQDLKEDISLHQDGMLQSLRLWNRALDSLMRLNSPSAVASTLTTESNPFQISSNKESFQSPESSLKETFSSTRVFTRWSSVDALGWRIAEGLLETLFSLTRLYFSRGSPREAVYFAQQARNLAESLNAPAMIGRALAKEAEVQIYQGLLDRGSGTLMKADQVLQTNMGSDGAEICRLRGLYNERILENASAIEAYQETIDVIKAFGQSFNMFHNLVFGSLDKSTGDIIFPELLSTVLRQKIWLLRDHDTSDYMPFLDRLLSLPSSNQTKTEENSLMAKMTLYDVYGRLHSDMFLCSIAESTIALPTGMSSKVEYISPSPVHDILAILDKAARLYSANLLLVTHRGNVHEVRETILSLIVVQAFQTSLGRDHNGSSYLAAKLLDASAAITLRRDMLTAINHKFHSRISDDIHWPLLESEGLTPRKELHNILPEHDQDADEASLKECWNSIRTRYYKSQSIVDPSFPPTSEMSGLPLHWTIIKISVTDDKSMLFVARQEGGESCRDPLIFCIPLKGRRDTGSGEDEGENLTFDDAMEEFYHIVKMSDEGTKAAVHIKENHESRAVWWKQRRELNARMRELLENIEYCWLGAFKTILSPRPYLTPELLSNLRSQFEKVFQRNLHVKDSKSKSRSERHKKSSSQARNHALSQVTLNDSLLECFSTLSPKCRDEEIEDLVYFILDLYQFHGIPIAIAEVDVVQIVVDLRGVLEDHALRLSQMELHKYSKQSTNEEHMFLILDKNLQCLPWESIPILRGRSISRIPSVDFLHDRLSLAKRKMQLTVQHDALVDRAIVNPRRGYYILNPSGDLHRTEGRFRAWATGMEEVGWEGVIGRAPSEQQFLHALQNQDLVVYFGHGGGEQYVRSHKIRTLPSCAVTMLWGCSSGALQDMGEFDRTGTPYSYMIAGCPTLVANLWDVTDKDIDLFSQSVFAKLHLTAEGIKNKAKNKENMKVSVVEAIAQSRDVCKLDYLTGAAPIIYGIPFYL